MNLYTTAELAGAGHAQCHAHLDRHLIDVGAWHKHTPWCERMRRVLTDAQHATRQALAAGLDTVPAEIAGPIRCRYDETLTLAFDTLPAGPPPKRRNQGGWLPKDRDAWNLATRFRVEAGQILLLLDNTAVPATNNHAERELRGFVLWRKQTGGTRSERGDRYAERVMTVVHTLRKQGRHVLSFLEKACANSLQDQPITAVTRLTP